MEWNMSSLWWRRARPCSATPPELRGADPCCGFSVLVSRELYACARTGYTQRKWNGVALAAHWSCPSKLHWRRNVLFVYRGENGRGSIDVIRAAAGLCAVSTESVAVPEILLVD
jgi:hypothetical protein